MLRRRALAVVSTLAIALGAAALTGGPAPAADDPSGEPGLVPLEWAVRPEVASGPTSFLLVLDTRNNKFGLARSKK